MADLETRKLSRKDLRKEGLAGLRVHLEQQHLIVRGCSARGKGAARKEKRAGRKEGGPRTDTQPRLLVRTPGALSVTLGIGVDRG